jgi:nucleotide-binding universal stress UspA family protein
MKRFYIVLATDGSAEATDACHFLRALLLPQRSTIHLLSVVPDPPVMGSEKFREAMELPVGDPGTETLELGRQRNVDLIVAGARGAPLIERLLQGSVVDRLLAKSHCSVLVVH